MLTIILPLDCKTPKGRGVETFFHFPHSEILCFNLYFDEILYIIICLNTFDSF